MSELSCQFLFSVVMLVRKQQIISTKRLQNTRRDFQPMVSFKKMTKWQKISSRRGLDWPGQASSTDQCAILLAEDHHDGLRWRAIHSSFWAVPGEFLFLLVCRISVNYFCKRQTNGSNIFAQVGQGDGYVLTVEGFNDARSTLGNYMGVHNGMKFSTR